MSDTKKILIIDDDPDIIESISLILNAEGFDVVSASSGEEGIAAVSAERPDLVLCDMMMETMDAGMKTAEMIMDTYHTLPVYLLSSIADVTAATSDVYDMGFIGVFQKPVDPGVLVSTLKSKLSEQ